MPHGLPDYGIFTAKETTFNLADMADLAVRMGSVVEYDRRGDVIYIDDYEAPIEKFRELCDPACFAFLDSTGARSGAQSLKLVTDGTINRAASIIYHIAPIAAGRHGIKISAALAIQHLKNQTFTITLRLGDGALRYWCGVRYNPVARVLQYSPDGAAWVTFAPDYFVFSNTFRDYHNLKLVVDLAASKFVRFLLDVREWDLSAYSLTTTPEVTTPYCYVYFEVKDLEGAILTNWLEDFVYTINEP